MFADCDGSGRWYDGSTAGGNVIRHWWWRLLVRRLFHAAEVPFSSSYSSIDEEVAETSLSPCAMAAVTLVMVGLLLCPQCMLSLEEALLSQSMTGGQQKRW